MRRTRKFTSDSREGVKQVPEEGPKRVLRGAERGAEGETEVEPKEESKEESEESRRRSLRRSRRGTESIESHLPVESRGSVLWGASPGASHQEAPPVGARLLAACSQSRNPIGAQSPSKEVAKSGKVPPQAVTSRWRDTRKG